MKTCRQCGAKHDRARSDFCGRNCQRRWRYHHDADGITYPARIIYQPEEHQ